jgi:hypothetical protein
MPAGLSTTTIASSRWTIGSGICSAARWRGAGASGRSTSISAPAGGRADAAAATCPAIVTAPPAISRLAWVRLSSGSAAATS